MIHIHATKLRMLLSKAEILLFLLGGACQAAESRLLSSSNRSSNTYTSYYGQYANASSGHPYLSIFLGIVLSAAIFTGFVFLVDRETFDEVIGQKLFCKCTRCRSAGVSVRNRCCDKPDIDDDDDYGIPTISPEFITPETAEYLSNKHDEEAERPKKILRATQKWVRDQSSKCLVPVKKYLPKSFINSNDEIQIPLPEICPKHPVSDKLEISDEDKYYIRELSEIPPEEQSLEDKVAYQLWEITEQIEDARVKMFWTPTRDLDKVMDGKDKYNVKGESKEYEIQCNSWFEEDEDAPWS